MADDPVGHPAAVAAAGDTNPGRIDGRILFTYVIHKLHEILEVDGAVFFSQVRELVAAAVAAPGVAEHDEISIVGEYLHLMEHGISKGHSGAAVHIQDRRVLL